MDFNVMKSDVKIYMHLYFARSRQSKKKQTNKKTARKK